MSSLHMTESAIAVPAGCWPGPKRIELFLFEAIPCAHTSTLQIVRASSGHWQLDQLEVFCIDRDQERSREKKPNAKQKRRTSLHKPGSSRRRNSHSRRRNSHSHARTCSRALPIVVHTLDDVSRQLLDLLASERRALRSRALWWRRRRRTWTEIDKDTIVRILFVGFSQDLGTVCRVRKRGLKDRVHTTTWERTKTPDTYLVWLYNPIAATEVFSTTLSSHTENMDSSLNVCDMLCILIQGCS